MWKRRVGSGHAQEDLEHLHPITLSTIIGQTIHWWASHCNPMIIKFFCSSLSGLHALIQMPSLLSLPRAMLYCFAMWISCGGKKGCNASSCFFLLQLCKLLLWKSSFFCCVQLLQHKLYFSLLHVLVAMLKFFFIYCIACLLQCELVAQKFFFCSTCLINFSLVTMVLLDYIFFPTFLLLLCWLCSMWLQWGTTTLDWHKFNKLLNNFGFVGKFCSLRWRCSKPNLIWGHKGSRKI